MNSAILKGKWNQLKGAARVEWGKLTDSDLEIIGGQRDKLVGKVQERYGKDKAAAEREVDAWLARPR